MAQMTLDEAIRTLRASPEYRQLMIDAFLGEDRQEMGERFAGSGEFAETLRILGGVEGKVILEVGAGTGTATFAFCRAGARVIAVEPDASDVVGRGAAADLLAGLACEMIDARGESVPLPDESVDVVYCRQVLHHMTELGQVLQEWHRVLRFGGQLLACREHVVDDATGLAAFQAQHPVHQLAGGENAYPLRAYTSAIRSAGFRRLRVLSRWDSVISAYPGFLRQSELDAYPARVWRGKLGPIGQVIAMVPGATLLLRRWWELRDRAPGRLYTFHAVKER